ncbi:MAG: hypothetical protein IPH23_14950, partial [Gammaproteobacteria bacterium]|nr:hypothetical protein [Gammaproteobacteria bacterium]
MGDFTAIGRADTDVDGTGEDEAGLRREAGQYVRAVLVIDAELRERQARPACKLHLAGFPPMITAQEFARRRRDLMATLTKNSIAILTAAPEQVRSRVSPIFPIVRTAIFLPHGFRQAEGGA